MGRTILAHRQDMWAAVLAEHARRALQARGMRPACSGELRCPPEPVLLAGLTRQAAVTGPLCVRCALAQAADRYIPPGLTGAPQAYRYALARLQVEEHVHATIGLPCAELTTLVSALATYAAALRRTQRKENPR